MKSHRFYTFTVLAALAALFLAAGCAGLQKQLDSQFPADKGNTGAQVADAVRAATTQPVIQAVAAPFPWGETVLTGIGAVAAIAAGIFKMQQQKAQGQLDVVQSATGTETSHDAVAAAVAATGAAPATNGAAPVIVKP